LVDMNCRTLGGEARLAPGTDSLGARLKASFVPRAEPLSDTLLRSERSITARCSKIISLIFLGQGIDEPSGPL